jgi:hypothetical protein
MSTNEQNSFTLEPKVWLDGSTVQVPKQRQSLAAIRTFLERLAMQKRRVLSSVNVENVTDEHSNSDALPHGNTRIVAESISLDRLPLSVVERAQKQATEAFSRVESAVVLMTINTGQRANEMWWNIAHTLNRPVVTLALLSEASLKLPPASMNVLQVRNWQLEQLACLIAEVDQVAALEDPLALSEALEERVLSWLDNLIGGLELLHFSLLTGLECECQPEA